MQSYVLASFNQGKVSEMQALLKPLGIEIQALSSFKQAYAPEETGLTFVENAIIKARAACAITKLPAIAEDSGLEVMALQGKPGIYSARYAGDHASDTENITQLFDNLKDIPKADRQAQYISCIVFMRFEYDPSPIICEGIWQGEILTSAQGTGGFGYDPIFYSPEYQCSAAELSIEQKNMISHRSKAIQLLLDKLKQQL